MIQVSSYMENIQQVDLVGCGDGLDMGYEIKVVGGDFQGKWKDSRFYEDGGQIWESVGRRKEFLS